MIANINIVNSFVLLLWMLVILAYLGNATKDVGDPNVESEETNIDSSKQLKILDVINRTQVPAGYSLGATSVDRDNEDTDSEDATSSSDSSKSKPNVEHDIPGAINRTQVPAGYSLGSMSASEENKPDGKHKAFGYENRTQIPAGYSSGSIKGGERKHDVKIIYTHENKLVLVDDTTPQDFLSTRDVSYFLESHPAHSIPDARAYFTDERTIRSLSAMLNDIKKFPREFRFAFLMRAFCELGRKITTKLNRYSDELYSILSRAPDNLGNKPEVSTLVDTVNRVFESKDDHDTLESKTKRGSIKKLIKGDRYKEALLNSSMTEMSKKLAHILTYFLMNAGKGAIHIPHGSRELMADMLYSSMFVCADRQVITLAPSDKFRVDFEIVNLMKKIFKNTHFYFKHHIKHSEKNVDDATVKSFKTSAAGSFADLSTISDTNGLIGPWNNFLFTNLGTAERVIKLFSNLLSRVPQNSKARWINMYTAQVDEELNNTLSSFVTMQTLRRFRNSSEVYFLNTTNPNKSMLLTVLKPRKDYQDDKNRVPARCYLAGRRWRIYLLRAMKGFKDSESVIKKFIGKISDLKQKLIGKGADEMHRLCLPRLEIGMRGWGIDGEPENEITSKKKHFQLDSPITGLNTMLNPFVTGINLGYEIGFKVGYNERRNATLQMERQNSGKKNKWDRAASEVNYLTMASSRHGTLAGSKKAFAMAIREGYQTALQVTSRAGLKILTEAGANLAEFKCSSAGWQAGKEAGRLVGDGYLTGKTLSESVRKNLIEIAEDQGAESGYEAGSTIGAIVGRAAANEAFRRSIIRGGKMERVKFNLEEYEAGALLGFQHGIETGAKVASSVTLDPSAPSSLRLVKQNSDELGSDQDSSIEVDEWEKDLIPPLTSDNMEDFHIKRNHVTVNGTLTGSYTLAKEVKRGLDRESYSLITYKLIVTADGFIRDDIAYLNLNGTINNMGLIHGSLVAKNIFYDD